MAAQLRGFQGSSTGGQRSWGQDAIGSNAIELARKLFFPLNFTMRW